MSVTVEEKLEKIPIVNWVMRLLKKVKLKAFEGLSLYDLLEMYVIGIAKGALSARAGAIAFSFFMAIFPFLLFVLNLIPFIPIENFQNEFLGFVESILPPTTTEFFDQIFEDIANNRRAGLLSTVFFLSIFLMTNGINAIFGGFEYSYHIEHNRSMFRQYFYAMGVAVLLSFLFLFLVAGFTYYEVYVVEYLNNYANKTANSTYTIEDNIGAQIGKVLFFTLIVYFSTAILYFFGTKDKIKFFSVGATLTTLLILLTTYLFGIYIDNFAQYNELYGSIGALLILMMYIWLNSNILLLGFELNASMNKLRNRN
jgi:membrane protein